jgi:hypothetical protein
MATTKRTAPPTAAEKQRAATIGAQQKAVIDEYGDLQDKLALVKPDVARAADLARSIRAWALESAADENVVFQGTRYLAILGPRGMESEITDMEAIYRILGHERFLALATMPLKALEAAGIDVAAVTRKDQTGTRALTITSLPNRAA